MKFKSMTMLGWLSAMIFLIPSNLGFAGDVVDFTSKGQLKLGRISAGILHFDKKWSFSHQRSAFKIESDNVEGASRHIDGTFETKGGSYEVRQSKKNKGNGKYTVSYNISSKTEVPTQQLSLSFVLPVSAFKGKMITIGKKQLMLPDTFAESNLVTPMKCSDIYLPTGDGAIQIHQAKMSVSVQDSRKYNTQSYELRIIFDGDMTSELNLDIDTKSEMPEKQIPVKAKADMDWKPYHYKLAIKEGSVFDMSSGANGPAGKDGPIVVNADGHFAKKNKPEERVKLMGTNLCFSANFTDKEESERLATLFQRMGYNTVRIHHYDQNLLANKKQSHGIDPKAMDKLDYLFSKMKEAGMYMTLDLYSIRKFSAAEVPEWGENMGSEIKALVPLFPSAFKAWMTMVNELLTHVNPYTGLAWKDDPAFFSVCPLNEDSIYFVWKSNPKIKELYMTAFREDLKVRGQKELEGDERQHQIYDFLVRTKMKSNAQIADALKEVSPHLLVTGSNFITDRNQAFMRNQFDFVDNHGYWDHPSFPEISWRMPHQYKHASAASQYAAVPRKMMSGRIFGKPHTVTEYNYCAPNIFRSEGGLMMGAYSALQDWDGLYRFAWSHSKSRVLDTKPIYGFDIATDPIGLLTERQINLLFSRGDVAPASTKVVYPIDWEEATTRGWAYSDTFNRLGLAVQIGSAPVGKDVSPMTKGLHYATGLEKTKEAVELPPWIELDDATKKWGVSSDKITSETGEIELSVDRENIKVVTSKSEGASIHSGSSFVGKALSVTDVDQFCSVSASSMDGAALMASRRVLLFHMTDVRNTNMFFRNQDLQILETWGDLPHLVRKGQAKLTLKNNNEKLSLYAIDMSGNRLEKVPTTYANGAYQFVLNTAPEDKESRMSYELAE